MATIADQQPTLDLRDQIVRIDKMQAEIQKALVEHQKIIADTVKVEQDTRIAPWAVGFTGLGAGAALMAAGVALAKYLMG